MVDHYDLEINIYKVMHGIVDERNHYLIFVLKWFDHVR